jgi:sulfatase maturation enzyme AslB (radical SAM superfamily)
VKVGISLDGTREVHDSAKVDLAGRGSYDRVVRGLKTAQEYGEKGLIVGTIRVLNPFENGTRYSEADGFSRKAVHCETLYGLFEHIETALEKRRQEALV